jgi:hypothetical protein
MKVTLNFDDNFCKVVADGNDPVFKRGGWSDAESTLLHHVKIELIKQGYDVIKKRMWRDGHMVDENQQYIRTRDKKKGFYIYNANYNFFDAGEYFNDYNEIHLILEEYS